MKVWIVQDRDDNSIDSVWSTEDSAMARREKLDDGEFFDVNVETVDDPVEEE